MQQMVLQTVMVLLLLVVCRSAGCFLQAQVRLVGFCK
jgi:hypothetical protein